MHYIHVAQHQQSTGHRSPITSVDFNPQHDSLATGSYDGTVKIWTTKENALVLESTLRHKRLVNGVRWSHDGRLLATTSADKTCAIWSADGDQVELLARHTDDVNSVAWSNNDSTLVTVSEDGTGRFWDIANSSLSGGLIAHSNHVMSVDWSSLDEIASCGEDGCVRTWSTAGEPVDVWPQNSDMEMCRWSHDGELLALACDDGIVRVLNRSGEEVLRAPGVGAAIKSLAWGPRDETIAIGAYDLTCRILDIRTTQYSRTYTSERWWPRSLCWSRDGKTIAVGTLDALPQIITINDDEAATTTARSAGAIHVIDAQPASYTYGINDLAIVSRQLALLACDDGSVRRLHRAGKDLNMNVLASAEQSTRSLLNSVAWNGGRDLVAAGGMAGIVHLWRTDGSTFGNHNVGALINCVAWSPGGNQLAISDYEGYITILGVGATDVEEVSHSQVHEGAIKSVVWFDESTLVTGATDCLVKIVDIGLSESESLVGHGNLIDSVAISDGPERLIASTSRDHTIRIWERGRQRPRRILLGHDESLKSIAWRPRSSVFLASGSYDFDIRTWDLTVDDDDPKVTQVIGAHGHAVPAIGWFDTSTVVSASWDCRAKSWDLAGHSCVTVEVG